MGFLFVSAPWAFKSSECQPHNCGSLIVSESIFRRFSSFSLELLSWNVIYFFLSNISESPFCTSKSPRKECKEQGRYHTPAMECWIDRALQGGCESLALFCLNVGHLHPAVAQAWQIHCRVLFGSTTLPGFHMQFTSRQPALKGIWQGSAECLCWLNIFPLLLRTK